MDGDKKENRLLEIIRRLGQMSARYGTRPSEAVQKIILSDKEKQEAFIEGAELGQRERFERESQKVDNEREE